MIPLDLINWDAWRATYSEMTLPEHQAVYDAIAAVYPVQKHFDYPVIKRCFNEALTRRNGPLVVYELGGWDGTLAKRILKADHDTEIHAWLNWELSQRAATAGMKGADSRYAGYVAANWLWDLFPVLTVKPQIFIATHAIEHLSWGHLLQLIHGWVNCGRLEDVILEAPIPEHGPVDWTGYFGTHILEVGWAEIAAAMAPAFDLVRAEGFVRHFVRRA